MRRLVEPTVGRSACCVDTYLGQAGGDRSHGMGVYGYVWWGEELQELTAHSTISIKTWNVHRV